MWHNLYEMSKMGKPIETESRVKRRDEEGLRNKGGMYFWSDENVLKLITMLISQLCKCTENQ